MRILCEVFGLFDKRGESEGGTPYIIKGAWGLGAYKGVAERRLTGGRKYAPKGSKLPMSFPLDLHVLSL